MASLVTSAKEFFSNLSQEQQGRLLFSFEADERIDWGYLPGTRKGIPLKELTASQSDAAYRLLKEGMSTGGFQKATGIIQLEAILRELEGRSSVDSYRDPGKYYFTFFGSPSEISPWGWRLEGHHLSLNFTLVGEALVGTTPAFFGTNPAEVRFGPRKGWRILKEEEDLSRQLVRSLDASQKTKAIIGNRAPADIITGSDRKANPGKPTGLLFSEMTTEQKKVFLQLLNVYLNNFPTATAEIQLKKIFTAGLDHCTFTWVGAIEPGQGHYYRIQGPSLLIEYDNTQNHTNHIHTVFRDLENDFGLDLLRKHYQETPHPH